MLLSPMSASRSVEDRRDTKGLVSRYAVHRIMGIISETELIDLHHKLKPTMLVCK